MALKQTNEINEVYLQNENLQTEVNIKAPNCNMKFNKSNASRIKCGLTELSNDKFYLETELPARKRFKTETELFRNAKHLNKICKAVGNDDKSANFVNEEKYSNEMPNVLSCEYAIENDPKNAELLTSDSKEDINELYQISSLISGTGNTVFQSSILSNQFKLNLHEIAECSFKKKSNNYDFEPNSENHMNKNLNKNKMLYEGELEFDDEINKCCELLNLDVPRSSVVETTATQSANGNFGIKMTENSQIYKCEIDFSNGKKQSLDTLNLQPIKLVDSLKSRLNYEDTNLMTTSVVKKLKMQDKINNVLNVNSISVRESKTFIPQNIQNQDSQSNNEHLNSTTANTLKSDTLKFLETNQENMFQNHLNDELSSTVSDSEDTLILYDGCDINFDETKDICKTNASESAQAMLEEISNNNATASLVDNTIRTSTSKENEKKDDVVLNENIILLAKNHPVDNVNGEPLVLNGILNNDHIGNINAFDAEVDKSFVSEYEISLLIDDTDSLNEGSIDSEYEISLLEDDINDEGNQDESFDSEYEVSLLEDDINDEGNQDESFDSEYEVSLLEDDINNELSQNGIHENKSNCKISNKYLSNGDDKEEEIAANLLRQSKESKTEQENDQTSNNNFFEKETKVVLKNNESNGNTNEKHVTDGKIIFKLVQTTTLKSEKVSQCQLKHEINNESQTQNKLALNSNEVRNSEENSANVVTNIYHVGSTSTENVFTELDTFDSGESKDVNNIFQPSNKMVLMKEPKRSEEKTLIVSSNKQLMKSTSIDKAIGDKTLKIDFCVSASSELKNLNSKFPSSELKNLNSKFQLSNKGVLMKETKRSEEKVLYVDTKKQFTKRTSTDKVIGDMNEKTDSGVTVNAELKNTNNKFQPSNKVVQINETKRSEEKALIVSSNKKLTESTSTDKATGEKTVKKNLGMTASSSKCQLSNKVVIMKETKRPEEKALIVSSNKQLTENTSIDKSFGFKTMKTDLCVSSSSELKDVNNKFQLSNKEVLMKETKISEEKALIVDTNKQLTKSKSTDKVIGDMTKNTDLCVSTNTELKNANNKFQPSNKVVQINETKISEGKTLIVSANKKLAKSTSIDDKKTVKTDLSVYASSELKQDAENIIPDYYEEEKEDLINPGWNKIKELSTDEERYCQVRDCWESKNIPNPFKNLTYYSYRKRKTNCGENNARQTKQHKRHASNNLNDNNAKRSRTCTYIFDDRIRSIKQQKEKKAQIIQNKMHNEVNRLNKQCLQEEMRLQNLNGYKFDPRRQEFELYDLRREFQYRITSVTAEYKQKVYSCCNQYTSEINSLKSNRNEVFQFYSFYKGLNPNEYKDPTVLTIDQMQELEEIENIYTQMDQHYE